MTGVTALTSAMRNVSSGWAADFRSALANRDKGRVGPLIVVVPDDGTLYAVQRECFDREQSWNACLTARYSCASTAAIGTSVAALAADILALAGNRSEFAGDLLDSAEGRYWASYAQGVVRRAGPLLAKLTAADRIEAADVGSLAEALAGNVPADPVAGGEMTRRFDDGLTAGSRLVLLVDSGSEQTDPDEIAGLAQLLSVRIVLVVTHRSPDAVETSLRAARYRDVLRIDGPVTGVPRTPRTVYQDSALASDLPADQDELGTHSLALTTARLLLHEGTGPLCLGIEAPWGKGKSTFLKLIEGEVTRLASARPEGPRATVVRFNAWTYDSSEQAWAGLAVAVLNGIESGLGSIDRMRMRLAYARHFHRGSLIGGAAVGFAAVLSAASLVVLGGSAAVDAAQERGSIVAAVVATVVSPVVVVLVLLVAGVYRLARPVSLRVTQYLSRPDYASRLGYQHRVIVDLKFAMDWVKGRDPGKRVIVMVDDLDRCSEDKVVELMQAVNVVLAESRIYTLLAIDGKMVRRAIFRHHRDDRERDLPEEYRLTREFSSEYLEKIVQFFIQLPPTSEQLRRSFVAGMFAIPEPVNVQPPSTSIRGQELDVDRDLAVDRLALRAPELVLDVTVTDTSEEQLAMADSQALLDDNPRELKRAVNIHRFVKLALYRPESPPDEETQRRLVLWVVLCLARPDAIRAFLADSASNTQAGGVIAMESILLPTDRLRIQVQNLGEALHLSDLPLLTRAADVVLSTLSRD
jgi:hypothetical protein